jgi:CheY-like chemotaxis protein
VGTPDSKMERDDRCARRYGSFDVCPGSLMALGGTRVLVVEDEPMLSLALQDMLADLGCVVAGTAARLAPALRLARELDFDVAVLDINLGGERVDPVAEAVAARRLPVVFLTGYGRDGVPSHVPGLVVEKPYQPDILEQALGRAMGMRDA